VSSAGWLGSDRDGINQQPNMFFERDQDDVVVDPVLYHSMSPLVTEIGITKLAVG
jgi:hypothetical protein